jgi:hypothetical protein
MEGALYDIKGNVVDPCDDYTNRGQVCPTKATHHFDVAYGQTDSDDIIPIETLLRAAGVTLEEAFEAGKPDSKRKTGIVLVMEIKYDNVQTSSTSIIEYKTYVTEVKGANFKSEQGLFNSNTPDQRMVYNRHGIRVLILQTGDLGHFDFTAMLVQLTASLSLIAVATTVVDLLMTKVMADKEEFKGLKVATSRDFYLDENDADDAQFQDLAGYECPVVWAIAQDGSRNFLAKVPDEAPETRNAIPLTMLDNTGDIILSHANLEAGKEYDKNALLRVN